MTGGGDIGGIWRANLHVVAGFSGGGSGWALWRGSEGVVVHSGRSGASLGWLRVVVGVGIGP